MTVIMNWNTLCLQLRLVMHATSFYPFGLTGNTKLIDISWDNIGALFALDSAPRYLSKTNIKGLQTAYNQVFQDIKAKSNDEIEYKKLALLPIILNFNTDNKFVGGKKMSFDYKMKCLLVRNDWSIFTLSLFRGRLKRIHSNDYTENDIDDEIQKLSHQQKLAKFMKDLKHTSLSVAYSRFLSDAVMAPSSEFTYKELETRFPQEPEDIPELSKDDMQEILKCVKNITSNMVLNSVKKLKRGKASSICTLYSEHVQQLTELNKNDRDEVKPANTQIFIDNLTWMMNAILKGLIPKEVMGWYGSTEGNIILPKPTKRRHISKPTVFSKIFDSIMHTETANKIEEHVKDIQFGASKFSCEKLSHVMRTGLELSVY